MLDTVKVTNHLGANKVQNQTLSMFSKNNADTVRLSNAYVPANSLEWKPLYIRLDFSLFKSADRGFFDDTSALLTESSETPVLDPIRDAIRW